MNLLGIKKKVLSRWMTLQADRKTKEARREIPDSWTSYRGQQDREKTIIQVFVNKMNISFRLYEQAPLTLMTRKSAEEESKAPL